MDDLRSRISALTRDIDRAVEVADNPAPPRREPSFEFWTQFAAMFEDSDTPITAEEIVDMKERAGCGERIEDFSWEKFEALFEQDRTETEFETIPPACPAKELP